MHKILSLLLIIFLTLLLFTACNPNKLLETNSPHLLSTACAYYSVPGFFEPDLKDAHDNIIETDNFGRDLVYVKRYNFITQTSESAYVIIQKYGNSVVYFYENINYMFINDTNKTLDDLKKANDWNSALNESKLSSRKVSVSFDMFLEDYYPSHSLSSDDLFSSLEKYSIKKDSVTEWFFCDWDKKNQVLFFMKLDNEEKYFFIWDIVSNDTFITKFEDLYDCSNELINLKSQSGWSYGS